jgi:glutaredoxin
MKKIFTVLLLGTALTLPACDDKKDDKKADDKAKTDKKDDKKADDKKADDKKAEEKAEEKKEEAKADGGTAAAPASTGDPVCDELIKKTMCSYEKAGAAVPAEAKKAFEDGVKAWTEALKNEATKKATSDACKASLDGGKAGFDAVGC